MDERPSSDVSDDDDDDLFNGSGRVEMTLDDAEDDDDEREDQSNGRCNREGGGDTDGESPKDSRQNGCVSRCSGCAACLRRFAQEVDSSCVDLNRFATSWRRKHPCSKTCWLKWIRKKFPVVDWLPRYTWRHLRGDVVAGLTTGFAVIPQAIESGMIVGVAPQYGLYSAIMGSFVYFIFGTAKDVAVGPSILGCLLTAAYATEHSPVLKDPTFAIMLSLFSGIVQASMGILHLGFIFKFVSLPVLKAFRAAAGITLTTSRIKVWWGLKNVPVDFSPQLYWTLHDIGKTNIYDLLLGGLCILMLFLFKKLKAIRWQGRFRDMPWYKKIVNRGFWILGAERNIITVVFASAVVYAMLNNGIPITYTGYIPPGIPSFTPPNVTLTVPDGNYTVSFSEAVFTIGPGIFIVSMLGMLETISVGQAFGRKGNYRIDYNQELTAIGLSNILTSFISGVPVCGAFVRSGINFNSGVKTPAGGLIAAAVVLVSLQIATPLMYYIPTCVLAATIILGGIDVATFHKFGIIWTTKRSDMIPYAATLLVSLTWGVQYGVFIGIGVHFLMLLYKAMTPKIKVLSAIDDSTVKVVSIQPKFGFLFPVAERILTKIENADLSSTKTVILDMTEVNDTDTSVIQTIKILRERNKARGVNIQLYNPQPAVEEILKRTPLKDACITPAPVYITEAEEVTHL